MNEFTCDGFSVIDNGAGNVRTRALDELIALVQRLVKEWGSENLLITVPLEWDAISNALNEIRKRRLAFTTDDTIEISIYVGCERKVHHVFPAVSLFAF